MSSDFEALLRAVARAPVSEPDLVGATLGPFRIKSRLGRGGMGVVYRATDTRLQREVAIKVLGARWAGTEGKARLVDEARSAARLNHPNIATVHEIAEHDGVELVAMELAPGGTLRGRVLRARELRAALLDVARALEHAHARGVIHRDLKPDNLARGEAGQVVVLDFGLSARREGEAAGTPGYMPREQTEGIESGPRADVYAFGRTAIELASGELPKPGHEGEKIDALPRDLRNLVMDCVSDRTRERPLDGAELVSRLGRRRIPKLAAAAVLALTAIAAVWLPGALSTEGPPSVASVPVLSGDAHDRGRFRAAVESLYAADVEGAKRQLGEPSSDEARALALLLAGLNRDAADVEKYRDQLIGTAGWPGLMAELSANSAVESLEQSGPAVSPESAVRLAAVWDDPSTSWFVRLMLVGFGGGDQRVRRLHALIAADPYPAITHWLLANHWLRVRDEKRARAAIDSGLLANPTNYVLNRTRASLLVSHHPASAIEPLERLIRAQPADLICRFLRVEAWDKLGERERMMDELARLLDDKNGFEPHLAARGVLASLRSLPARGEAKAARPLTEKAIDSFIERGAWEAVAAWLPRLYDEALARRDTAEAERWSRLINFHRSKHPDLEAVSRLLEGDLRAAPQLPEGARIAARLRFAAEPSATNERLLRETHMPHTADLLVAKAKPKRRDALLKGLIPLADECSHRTLWWQHICRVAVAEAAILTNDKAALAVVWPDPDEDAPLLSAAQR